MKKKKFLIKNPIGLHARPAANLVDITNKYRAKIKISFGDMEINAKSIISVLSLGLGRGDEFTLIVEGPNEEKAMQHLEDFILQELTQSTEENNNDFI